MTSSGAGQPAGWYHAAGDPPGTHRYWDGTQWQGDPQPVVAAPGGGVAGGAIAGGVPAEHGPRFIAALIDGGVLIVLFIAVFVLGALLGAVSDGLGAIVFLFGLLGVVGFALYNNIYLQGNTGQTIGKKHQNLKLVADATGAPVGIGQGVLRWLLSGLINSVCMADNIAILINDDHRRFSDKMLDMHVVQA